MTIWTIGHSNHPLETFLDLLAKHRIEVLVDVRSSPYSRYASHFNKAAIEGALLERDIKYLFLGDCLGGRAEGEQFYDEQGYVLYDRLADSPTFRRGVDRLLEGIARLGDNCIQVDALDARWRPKAHPTERGLALG